MLLVRSLVFDALIYALMAVMGIGCAPMALWSVDGAYAAMKGYCRAVFWLLRVICGLRVEIRGTAPEGEVIVCGKHQSFLDIMMLVHALPRPKFIMKKELRWAPVLGLYALRIGSTPVDRGARSKAMSAMVAHVKRGREAGQLVIYPQGTRVAPGAWLPYKIGAGVLYERLGVPCVPAATNAGVFWGRRSPYRRPGHGGARVPRADPAGPVDRRVHGAHRADDRGPLAAADARGGLRRRCGARRGLGDSARVNSGLRYAQGMHNACTAHMHIRTVGIESLTTAGSQPPGGFAGVATAGSGAIRQAEVPRGSFQKVS